MLSGILELSSSVLPIETLQVGKERCVRVEVRSANQFGQIKIAGEALVALP